MAVVDRKMVDWRSYLNEKVFKSGVPLPFWNISMASKLIQHEHALLIILDFLYESPDYMDASSVGTKEITDADRTRGKSKQREEGATK